MDSCKICTGKMKRETGGRLSGISTCVECGHVLRDARGETARAHPWGGNSAFDRARLWLTLRRVSKLFLHRGAKCAVLDIGYGSGILLRGLLERGCQIAGVDKNLLDITVDTKVRERATLYSGDIDSVILPSNSFDIVLGIHVIEHVEDARRFVQVCHRALRPGGHLYLLTPNASSAGLRIFGDSWWNLEDPSHIQFFSPRSIRRLLEDEGYDDVRTSRAIWDSLTVETNSLWRYCGAHAGAHGVLATRWLRLADVALLPLAMMVRLVAPSFSSTLEVAAMKKP